MADTIIDKVQVQIEATTKGTSQAFKTLDIQLSRLQNALNAIDTSKLQMAQQATKSISLLDSRGFTKEEREVKNTVNRIKQSFESLRAYKEAALGGDASSLTSFSRKAIHLQSDIDGLQERLRQVEDMMKDGNLDTAMFQTYREQLAEVVRDFGKAKDEVSSAVQAMNEEKVTLDTEESKSNLDILKEKARSAANTIASTIGRGAINAFKNLASNIKKAASHMKDLGHSTNGATGNFKRGFMTVLKYGFGIRSLYVLFRRLRKAVVESFGELQKSGAFYETTRANIEALKASLTTLKYQFGAAFEPIFNAIAPALQTLINYLITAANAISAFMAKLTGKSTYSKAVASANDLADATGGAAKAQKELNKQLQGFDELNNLSSNNPSGGGGGGGASGDSSAVTYVEESVENALGDFGKKLAEAIRKGDWHEVGAIINEKLCDAMESVNWNQVYQKAQNFGKGLADFLNGLISPRLFGDMGMTLASAINTAFEFLNSFGTTFDWTNFGASIGTGISEFFRTADFKLYGETVHTWVAGILDAGIALLKNTDFEEIGKKIADFLNGLSISDIAAKLFVFASNLIGGIAKAIEGLWSNSDVSTKIGLAVIGLVAAANLTGLSAKLGSVLTTYLASNPIVIGKAAIAVGTFVVTFEGAKWLFGEIAEEFDSQLASYYKNFSWSEFIETIMAPDGSGVDWSTIKKAWNDMMDEYFKPLFDEVASAITIGQNIVDGIKQGIVEKAKGIGDWVKGKFNEIITAVKDLFEINSPSEVFKRIGINIVEGLLQGIEKTAEGIGTWIYNTLVAPILNAVNFSGMIEKGKALVENIKSGISQTAGTIKDFFTNNVTSKITAAWDTVKDLKVNFASKYDDIKDSVEAFQKKIAKGLKTTIQTKLKAPKKDNKKSVAKKIKNFISGGDNDAGFSKSVKLNIDVSSTIGNLKSWVNNNIIKPLNDTLTDLGRKVKGLVISPINPLAKGGALYGGSWHSIPQFASGTTDALKHGTVFVGGENGPEVAGHINGRTEILNRSQLASTMHSAIINGMRQFKNAQMVSPPTVAYANGMASFNATSSQTANNDLLMAEQNQLIAEQNRLLQIIANKNVTISSRDVFNATRQEAQNYNNRTGNSPFLF